MTGLPPNVPWRTRPTCTSCGTELDSEALACPACHTLVHAARLRLLASQADAHVAAGRLREARVVWEEALSLLPPKSQQHATISKRVLELAARITDADEAGEGKKAPVEGPWWKRWGAGIVALLVLVLTKGKLLLLGLTKLPTALSMFTFFSVYWAAFGWQLALGLVMSIYIHEMGHVAALLRLGMKPSAPMFIPGLGAFVSYSRQITDPREDAVVGLAGPIWGAAAGLVAFAVAAYTGNGTWLAIAKLTGVINLFNLLPMFGLDGSHGFKALSAPQRALVAVAFGATLWFTGFRLLIVHVAIAGYRVFGRDQGPGDMRTLVNFIGLIAVLGWMASLTPL